MDCTYYIFSHLKSWCPSLSKDTLLSGDEWRSRQWCPVLEKEPWVYSALLTTEAISGLGGQTVKGKRFVQSSHKTETKRNTWNRKQWPWWHDSQRERPKAEIQEGKSPGSTGTPSHAEHSTPGLLRAPPEHLLWWCSWVIRPTGTVQVAWASGEESACHCRRRKRHGFNPWVGKIPWIREWQPTPVLLPGESHGQRSLAGYSP